MSLRWLLPFASNAKSGPSEPFLSDERALTVQPYGGRWYHASKQGRVFTGNAGVAGSVLPIFSNTAQVFGIWNPAGSGVNAVLINLAATYVDTTGAAGGFCLAIMKNAGSALATGGISAFTETAPERGLCGTTGGNKVRFTASAATVIAPTLLRQLGINTLVLTAADATNPTFSFNKDFDGDLVVAPNARHLTVRTRGGKVKYKPDRTQPAGREYEEGRVMMGVGMPASLKLHEFGSQVWAAFGSPPYHVGSSLKGKVWRDVDVRLILEDDQYEAWGFGDPKHPQSNGRWVVLVLAFSALGREMTGGLPIDFQIQQQSHANEEYGSNDHPRSCLGIVPLRRQSE